MERSWRTAAVRAGIDADTAEGAVVPPIYLSTNYRFDGLRSPRSFDYSRSGNPTRSHLADALAELVGAAGAVVTASGMGAITTALMALVAAGDTVVAPHDAYGGTWRLLDALSRRVGALEDFVGKRLFTRQHFALVMVQPRQGEQLRHQTGGAVDALHHLAQGLAPRRRVFGQLGHFHLHP